MNDHRLVEITPATHRVEIDLVYATDRNLTGKPIYRNAHCLLLEPAEAALRRAVEVAAQAGVTLRLYDAYRPPQAQQVLWDFLPDPNFVADLGRGSNHSRGTALDLTLIGANGAPLDMGDRGVGIGMRQSDTALKASIDGAIASMLKDGTYDRIAKQYFDFNPYGD